MKRFLSLAVFVGASCLGHATLIEFDISPSGSSPGSGLSPLNEVIPGPSSGSGGEISRGILFDTSAELLALNIGYGSAEGFSDLSGPAFSWMLHGPALTGETAPVMFDLGRFHSFAPDPIFGGRIVASLSLMPDQVADLLAGLTYINIYTPKSDSCRVRPACCK